VSFLLRFGRPFFGHRFGHAFQGGNRCEISNFRSIRTAGHQASR
jgi:hypothetical protein